FFSSRRRHTRLVSDWSSDVCSSDLMRQAHATGVYLGAYGWVENLRPAAPGTLLPAPPGENAPVTRVPGNPGFTHAPSLTQAATRSEERRVGKEGRHGWEPERVEERH